MDDADDKYAKWLANDTANKRAIAEALEKVREDYAQRESERLRQEIAGREYWKSGG